MRGEAQIGGSLGRSGGYGHSLALSRECSARLCLVYETESPLRAKAGQAVEVAASMAHAVHVPLGVEAK